MPICPLSWDDDETGENISLELRGEFCAGWECGSHQPMSKVMWLGKIIKGVSRDGKQKSKDWTWSVEVGKVRRTAKRLRWARQLRQRKTRSMSDPGRQWKKDYKCFYVLLNLILETPLPIAPMSMSMMSQVRELRLTAVGPRMHSLSRNGLETEPLIRV